MVAVGLGIVIAMVAWSIEGSRHQQSASEARHVAVMDLVNRIQANQAAIQESETATAVWRAEMRPLIERMVDALERVEPFLIQPGKVKP